MINLKETKRIKEALTQSPDDYQQIIEETDLAICITNSEGKFVTVNQNYLKLYGYTREQLVGNDFTLVVPPAQREALKQYHTRFFVDKYEILRKWEVVNQRGEVMEIFADAGYLDHLQGRACKVTFIQPLQVEKKAVQADGKSLAR